jgi:hypothetical protein
MMSAFTAIMFILIVLIITIGWLWAFITLCRPNRHYAYSDDGKPITDSDGNKLTIWGYWVDPDNLPLQLN